MGKTYRNTNTNLLSSICDVIVCQRDEDREEEKKKR